MKFDKFYRRLYMTGGTVYVIPPVIQTSVNFSLLLIIIMVSEFTCKHLGIENLQSELQT